MKDGPIVAAVILVPSNPVCGRLLAGVIIVCSDDCNFWSASQETAGKLCWEGLHTPPLLVVLYTWLVDDVEELFQSII